MCGLADVQLLLYYNFEVQKLGSYLSRLHVAEDQCIEANRCHGNFSVLLQLLLHRNPLDYCYLRRLLL